MQELILKLMAVFEHQPITDVYVALHRLKMLPSLNAPVATFFY